MATTRSEVVMSHGSSGALLWARGSSAPAQNSSASKAASALADGRRRLVRELTQRVYLSITKASGIRPKAQGLVKGKGDREQARYGAAVVVA